VEGLSDEQLLKIPDGLNNNLLWQLGHLVSTGQGLSYRLSGLPQGIPSHYGPMFGKDSSPLNWDNADDIDISEIKSLLLSTLTQTRKDIEAGIFKEYTTYQTSFGVTLNSFEESLIFRNVHEGLHLGSMMALRKLV
jgi:hypothetical protein